jgi:hypothetical protein
MILTIPYKSDGRDGRELKYCIRSMQKHFATLSGVLLIGDLPSWYTGDYLPASDIPGRKEWSIVSKILQCPYDRFLICSDDVFALADFDESLPMYYSGPLAKVPAHGQYAKRVANTRLIYPNGLMYDIHQPMIIDRALYHAAHNIPWHEREYLNKSIYGNFVGGGVQLDDYKIRTREQVDMTRPFFSTNDRTAKYVRFDDIYPEKSRYEKT